MLQEKTVQILITGDFCPINRVEELALKGDFDAVFNDFMDVLSGNDLNIVDLECPLTLTNSTRPKSGPYQKAHPATIGALRHAGVSLVAMANNHMMDYGSQGVKDTMELCQNNEIQVVGAGKSIQEASHPYVTTIKGKRIAIINYADNEFLSTPDGKYQGNPLDPVNCFNDITSLRQQCDFIIALVHAGNEFYGLPSPRTKKLYRFLIDAGADAVVSHHTHTFTGYEVYKGKPVFYGLGNFVYDWPGKIHSEWNRGYVVVLKISNAVDFQIVPLKQGNEFPGVFQLNSEEITKFNKDLEQLSAIISDDHQLEQKFQEYCQSVFPMYDAFIEPYFGKYVTAMQKRRFLPKILSRRKRLLYLNLIRCESHRDVLLRMLKKYE